MKQNKLFHFYQMDAVLNMRKFISDLDQFSLKSITLNYFILVMLTLIINIFFQNMFVEKLSSVLKKIPFLFVYAPIIEAHFKFLPYYLGALVFLHFFLPFAMIYTSYFYSLAFDIEFKKMFKIWFIAISYIPLIIALPFFIGIFLLFSFIISLYLNFYLSKILQKSFWHSFFIIQQLAHLFLLVLYIIWVF